jgi:geranylgeranyl diphosphate synthase type II
MGTPPPVEMADLFTLEREDPGFVEYLSGARTEINGRISALLRPACRNPADGVRDRFLLRGKRVRGAMTMLVFDALSGSHQNRPTALDLAAAVEVSHSTSLIIDDMIDRDEVRRGEPSMHAQIGSRLAMLEAVGLLSVPYSIAARCGTGYIDALCAAHKATVDGACEELVPGSPGPTLEGYIQLISLKTGALLELASRFGAMAAGMGPRLVDLGARYGLLSGRVLQVADDIVELSLPVRDPSSYGGSASILASCCSTSGGRSDHSVSECLSRLLNATIEEAEAAAAVLEEHIRKERADDVKAERRALLRAAPGRIADMILQEGLGHPLGWPNASFGAPLKRLK